MAFTPGETAGGFYPQASPGDHLPSPRRGPATPSPEPIHAAASPAAASLPHARCRTLHRSKPGGHPGHDQSRRLSLPPVVAPEVFESMLCCTPHRPARAGRNTPPRTSSSPDPYRPARRRPPAGHVPPQGRHSVEHVEDVKDGARRASCRRETCEKPRSRRRSGRGNFFASGASIVETSASMVC